MSNPETILKGLKIFSEAQAKYAEKNMAAAAELYRRALIILPNHPNVIAGYAQLAEDAQDWISAEKLYRKLGELRPDSSFEARLAHALYKQKKYSEAISLYEIHLAREPDEPGIMHGLAIALAAVGRWQESLGLARRSAILRPDAIVVDSEIEAMYHLAMSDELDIRLETALAKFPDSRPIRSHYALHKLKAGDFENGFRYFSDLRWRNNQRTWDARAAAGLIGNDEWDGKPFDGVLIINAEQGIGDEIMLSSMFDDIIATGQRVMIECDERLIPLYSRTYPNLPFMARRKERKPDLAEGTVVKTITALDAARVLRNTRSKFTARPGWLRANPEKQQAIHDSYRARWPAKHLVGISWKSTRIMEGAHKNIELTDLAPVLASPDCVFINLQYGDTADDIAKVHDIGVEIYTDPDIDALTDIDTLAAQIAALDLVISTSNTTVHVAGALGVPCWLLLPKAKPVLWYWGYKGDTTPWYPSLRLFRNAQHDEWADFASSIAGELARLPKPSP